MWGKVEKAGPCERHGERKRWNILFSVRRDSSSSNSFAWITRKSRHSLVIKFARVNFCFDSKYLPIISPFGVIEKKKVHVWCLFFSQRFFKNICSFMKVTPNCRLKWSWSYMVTSIRLHKMIVHQNVRIKVRFVRS